MTLVRPEPTALLTCVCGKTSVSAHYMEKHAKGHMQDGTVDQSNEMVNPTRTLASAQRASNRYSPYTIPTPQKKAADTINPLIDTQEMTSMDVDSRLFIHQAPFCIDRYF